MTAPPKTMTGFHLPVRLTIWPPMVADSSWVRIIGMVIIPALVGEWPAPSGKYWVRNTAEPNIATPTKTLATIIITDVRLLSTRSGSTGSGTRSSTTTVAAATTRKAIRYAPDSQESQPSATAGQ